MCSHREGAYLGGCAATVLCGRQPLTERRRRLILAIKYTSVVRPMSCIRTTNRPHQ